VACLSPLIGWRSMKKTVNGKRAIILNMNPRNVMGDPQYQKLVMPCGKCLACKLERARQWSVRCIHEASLHSENCFVTLTYSDQELPRDGSIDVTHVQRFMRDLRREVGKVRFFACGEYGSKLMRPHYHVLLFGYDFPDKIVWKSKGENTLYKSDKLENIWARGHCLIGEVTSKSAAYVARYITKKVTGEEALEHYNKIDNSTGEIVVYRKPEFITMSRNKGIGHGWLLKYSKDVYTREKSSVVVGGKEWRPPRYYDQILSTIDSVRHEAMEKQRVLASLKNPRDISSERLNAERANLEAKQKLNDRRSYENGD